MIDDLKNIWIVISFVCFGVIALYLDIHSNTDATVNKLHEQQNKELRLQIEQLKLREVKKDKHITYLLQQYQMVKDTIAIERSKVKIKYIRYEQPVHVDLSSDSKRDSVINRLIR